MKGRSVGKLRGSGGTDEDCLPVNELNASNTERTTAGLLEGGERDGERRAGRDGAAMAPPLGGMSASRCARLFRSITLRTCCLTFSINYGNMLQ